MKKFIFGILLSTVCFGVYAAGSFRDDESKSTILSRHANAVDAMILRAMHDLTVYATALENHTLTNAEFMDLAVGRVVDMVRLEQLKLTYDESKDNHRWRNLYSHRKIPHNKRC